MRSTTLQIEARYKALLVHLGLLCLQVLGVNGFHLCLARRATSSCQFLQAFPAKRHRKVKGNLTTCALLPGLGFQKFQLSPRGLHTLECRERRGERQALLVWDMM